MATQHDIEPGYTTELHIRLKVEERQQLQARADELGMSISQAARRILFGGDKAPAKVTEKMAHYRTMQSMQGVRDSFKKISTDLNRVVNAYEQSLSQLNTSGEPAVNTTQTLRVMSSIVTYQVRLQEGLNEIIRQYGGSEIHIAAKPNSSTKVGAYLAGNPVEDTAPAKPKKEDSPPPGREVAMLPDRADRSNEKEFIPFNFLHMFVVTFHGTLVEAVETYKDRDYEKILLKVRTDFYRNRQESTLVFDAVDFINRYRSVLPLLTAGRKVMISGELYFSTDSYNGKASESAGTVEIKSFNFLDQNP